MADSHRRGRRRMTALEKLEAYLRELGPLDWADINPARARKLARLSKAVRRFPKGWTHGKR